MNGVAWTEAEDALLGTDTDAVIAQKLGRSKVSVARRRHRKGIKPALPHGKPPVRWTPAMDLLLGTRPDQDIAEALGLSKSAVHQRRNRLKIKRFYTGQRRVLEQRGASVVPLKRLRRNGNALFSLPVLQQGLQTFKPEEPIERPKSREDCRELARPCLYFACRHHLLVGVNLAGGVRLNRKDVFLDASGEKLEQLPYTCALDAAEQGGMTLEEVGEHLGLTRERVRQIETHALEKLREALPPDAFERTFKEGELTYSRSRLLRITRGAA